jgi:lipopolysaccharide transport system permease protein
MLTAGDTQMGVRPWSESLVGLRHRIELMWMLTIDELRRTYKGSLLGLCWVIVKPVMMIALYTVLFGFLFHIRGTPDQTSWHYLLVILSGLLPWQMFAESLSAAIGAISSNAGLVTKILFPVEILPVSKVVSAMIVGLVSFLFFVAALVSMQRIGWTIVLLPFLLMAQLVFTVGLAWALSAFNVAIRDTNQVLPFVLTLGMFLSPVVYTPAMVPTALAAFFSYNPMSYFLTGYRSILLDNQVPPVQLWLIVGVLSGSVFFCGWWIFGRMRLFITDNI